MQYVAVLLIIQITWDENWGSKYNEKNEDIDMHTLMAYLVFNGDEIFWKMERDPKFSWNSPFFA